ncbi:MAG: dienelactone hydrolase family protein [Proteobacteria bacterium]|nr:dienelactone hydrolase family protein [Pseudomonadota bacterium]
MPKSGRYVVALLAAVAWCAQAQDTGPKREEFVPKSGSGRVVVIVSGQSGMPGYRDTAQQIADAGFDVTLVDGNEYWLKDTHRAWDMVKELITSAQAGPHALPGKAGVVGYSLGGGVVLTYAARMPSLVETVVAGYPLTSFIKDPADFVSKIKVPVLMFAGTADTYKDCCLIEKARALADAAKATSPPLLTLVEYNGVGHGFNLPTAARKDQASGQDALEKTIARLKEALPAK